MIRLHPTPDVNRNCPFCDVRLNIKGWHLPGMRMLADLKCPQCNQDFYGDLPAGHGLYYPMLIEKNSGTVYDDHNVEWFANWLRDSYKNRVNYPIKFVEENSRPLKCPILLNCLDTLYGHSLLKLLNAQYYLDHCPENELVLLIPSFLRWMVPEGVASVWTVDLPLRRGTEWNDWLAEEIKRRLEPLEQCLLSISFSHPHPRDYSIERFTNIHPFPIQEWTKRLDQLVVTFIWREDRNWWNIHEYESWLGVPRRMKRRLFGTGFMQMQIEQQERQVIALAQILREDFPEIDFAVVGMGRSRGLPSWISDLRNSEITKDVEIAWCERYSRSHIVIGVHGSNMLLPSAHAGSVIELVPDNKWANLIQDSLMSPCDVRKVMYRYRFLPLSSSPRNVALVSASLIRYLPIALLNFQKTLVDHNSLKNGPWQIIESCERTWQEWLKWHRTRSTW